METTFKVRDRYTGLYFNNGQWLAEPQIFTAGSTEPDALARIGYGREVLVHTAPWLPAVVEATEDLDDFDGYW